MLRTAMSLISPAGRRARLSILIFHRVHAVTDPLFPEEVDAKQFRQICGWVSRWCCMLPLSEAVERLYRHDLPARAAALTFDDGYADNLAVAAPVLQELGLDCTFFIATGFLDGGCMWNDVIIESIRRTELARLDLRGLDLDAGVEDLTDLSARRRAIELLIARAKYLEPTKRLSCVRELAQRAEVRVPADLMLTTPQVRDLHSRGFEIGGHTVSHPILARLGRCEARREIETGKRDLEDITGDRVKVFAYPNGKPGADYGADAVGLAREAGFDAAVSTAWGVSTSKTDRFQLARFTPWDRKRWKFGLRLARNAQSIQESTNVNKMGQVAGVASR